MSYKHLEKLLPHDYLVRPFLFFIPKWVRPNHLTVLRFLLTPVCIWLFVIGNYKVGIPVFIFASLTDLLDGSLARIRKQVTAWGVFYDPVADKLLIASVLIVAAIQYLNIWVLLGLIVMELSILIGGLMRNKKELPAANLWGKWKMVMEFVALTILLIAIATQFLALIPVATALFIIAILLGVISLLTYSL